MHDTIPVRPDERLDIDRVQAYLQTVNAPGLEPAPLHVEQFWAGHSNLTYLLRAGSWEGVLRRPPFGPVPARAHDVAREFGILERLHPVYPLAPQPFALCTDLSVIGAPFYVMERRRGLVLDQDLPPGWVPDPALHHDIAASLVHALVQLHAVDWSAAGLGAIGRPAGYLGRQVAGWIDRGARAQIEPWPELEPLHAWFSAHLPESPPATMIHNDYKLNNVLLDPRDPRRLSAILDWEMATVGDPLSDVAQLLVYWTEPTDATMELGGLRSVTQEPGFPDRAELLTMYADAARRPLPDLQFYVAFAYFKIAVILQQIYVRWHQGQTHDDRFQAHGAVARGLIAASARTAGVVTAA